VKDDAEFIAARLAGKAETAVIGSKPNEDEAARRPLAVGVAQEVY